ncbi:MAG: S-layer homology domain-containing protein, partial [Oscillospiraceae bacterium]
RILSGGDGGNITITGGTVTATGGSGGAGIGGGFNGAGGTITISGGKVTAKGGTNGTNGAGIGGGSGGGSGSFRTQEEGGARGSAMIFTSSISDEINEASWSGIILLDWGVLSETHSGTVYGEPTLPADLILYGDYTLTIPAGASLTVPGGKTLSIKPDAALINNGTLYCSGTTVINGTLTNSGAIYVDGILTKTATGTVNDDGVMYYLLTLTDCKVDETNTAAANTSTVNGKTFGKVGAEITLAATPSANQLVTDWDVTTGVSVWETVDRRGCTISSMPDKLVTVKAEFDTALTVTKPDDKTIDYGQTTTLSVTVSKHSAINEHTRVYQWYLDGSPISGATGSSYTTPADLAAGVHTYTCTITYRANMCVYTVTSDAATVKVNPLAEAAPNISIDYETETLTGFVTGSKYTIDGTAVTPDNGTLSAVDYIGKTISIVTKASDSNHADSTAQTLAIPAQPPAPSRSVCAINYSNETISFDSSKYEVNTAADFTGTPVANNGIVTPGTPLYVRQKASGISFASEATPVPIPARPEAPSISGSYAVSTTDSTKFIYTVNSPAQDAGKYEYRMDSGAWQPSASFDSIDPLSQHTFSARLKATVSAMAGAESSITVTFSKLTGGGSVTMQGWTYGETAKAPVASSDKNGTAYVTYSYEGINGTNYPSSTNIPTNAGEYQVTATFAATAVYQEATATATFTINPRPVTVSGITAQNKTYDGKSDTTLVYTNVILGGKVEGDDLSVTATGTFETKDAGTNKTVNITGLTLGGASVGNYILANGGQQTAATASITARDITVSITPGGGCYGNITPATAELNDLVDGENPTVTLTYTGTANDGTSYNSADAPTKVGSYTVTASISDPNYNLTGTVTGTFVVTRAEQTAPDAPTVKSKTYSSVTLNDIEDSAQSGAKAQYSMDGGTTWQDSPEFTGLSARTEYSFVARYVETDNYVASPVSAALKVTTNAAPSSGGITYPPTVEQPDEGGSVTTSTKNPTAGSNVTITPEPDEGYEVDQVVVTDKNGNPVEVTDNGDGTYSFTQPSGKVTVTVTFKKEAELPFVDVGESAYYYDAVLWAAKNGITGGTGDGTTFSPNAPCTRAQIVTFLWRAAGCPEPESLSSFADVSEDSYYAKAVAWAVENGITNGTGDGTTFSPNATCSRGQIVTFLWRSQKSPAADGANSFTDVAADSYCADAVQWAVENGITNGTGDGTTFSPKNDCTRAQIVTFLYRFFAK